MKQQEKTMVTLKSKSKKPIQQSFEISQANRILKLPNSQWKLDDKGFNWNGTEIAKEVKK